MRVIICAAVLAVREKVPARRNLLCAFLRLIIAYRLSRIGGIAIRKSLVLNNILAAFGVKAAVGRYGVSIILTLCIVTVYRIETVKLSVLLIEIVPKTLLLFFETIIEPLCCISNSNI